MVFSSLHPTVSALYFISVLLITMFTSVPMLQLISLIGAIGFLMFCGKKRIRKKESAFYALLFFLVTLTNPLFSHNGQTVLFFINNNPVTLESLYYGMYLGIMLISVVCWFRCFNVVITEDKLLYLLGKFSYKLALLISSALRFVPLLKRQTVKIKRTQLSMGLYSSESWLGKIKSTLSVYSSLIGWALENAIDTGASMKARGYGLKGRKTYSHYKMRLFDVCFLFVVIILDSVVIYSMLSGETNFTFYPSINAPDASVSNVLAMCAYMVLCMLPFILELKENILWRYCRSRIECD